MRIEMSVPGGDADEALREHAERRFLFALSRFSDRVRAVRITLRDENGPRGGVDKRCAVRLSGPGLPPLQVEVVDAQVEAALDRAADVARRAVVRALERRRPDVRRAPSHSGLRGPRG